MLENEIFVQIPHYVDYFGSNHGRLLSKKRGTLKLRKQNVDASGHINYVLTQRCRVRDGHIIGSPKRWVLGA